MKLKITTLIIVEGVFVENIFHSLNDNQDKAYQELLRTRNHRDSRAYINWIQNSPTKQRNQMKKKTKNQVYIPHQDKWNEHFPTPGKPNPNYYTDSGATFNKHLRTQNKLKQKRK